MPEKFSPEPLSENPNNKKWLSELHTEKTRNIILSYVYSLKMGFLPADAEDIAQQVMIKASEAINADKFRGESQLPAWLYQITKNLALNILRQQTNQNRHKKDPLYSPHEAKSSEPTGEDKFITGETSEKLRAQIHKLSPKRRQVMELVLEGKNNRQISEQLDMNLVTVRTHQTRARQILKEQMKKEDKKL